MKGIECKILLPDGFEASVEGKKVSLSNAGKKSERQFHAEEISFEKSNNAIVLRAARDSKKVNTVMNAIESLLQNMIAGLQKEFEFKLAVVYSHFPINVAVKGNIVEISNFAGEKKPRKAKIFGNAIVQVKGKDIIVKGQDKEAVGQTAAAIENAARVKGKDKRIFQDGIYLVGKSS